MTTHFWHAQHRHGQWHGHVRRATTVCMGALLVSSCASASGGATAASESADNAGGSELSVIDSRVGTGARAGSHDCAYVHFVGVLANGQQFDTSRDTLKSGQPRNPIAFELGTKRVMPGWEQGIPGMRVGGLRRLWVPFQMAYGAKGQPPLIPPRTDLVFDIELMAVAPTVLSSSNAPRADGAPTCPSWGIARR